MSDLISGKEALIALTEGKEVEYYKHKWLDVGLLPVGHLTSLNSVYKFRLKPKTITLNGIEVPCCGENYQYGDAMYILNSLEPKEYSLVVLDIMDGVPPYWWKSEDEIKQVVSALKTIFKTN